MGRIKETWDLYKPVERRNIMIYIVGIMFYKLGLEAFNGSIVTLATDRFEGGTTFYRLGVLTGLNQAMQCVGSILIAPLIKRFPTRSVLAVAVGVFGLITMVLLIVDAGTGGRIKPAGAEDPIYGTYNPDGIFPIYCISGIAYGMVELIRRVIPRDIVGGHVGKLKRMDAIVHVFYEIAGTGGAFASVALITRFGNNYSFFITPIFFTFAAAAWSFVSVLDFKKPGKGAVDENGVPLDNVEHGGYSSAVAHGFWIFAQSVYKGAWIVFTKRKFIWLVPGYSFALYGHRYLESGLAPAFARRILQRSAYSQIMVGGSNFGELLGALTVFMTANAIPTPIPFIRLDALLLLIVWFMPFYYPPPRMVSYAWRMAGIFTAISYGWAAGDVSLAAYIQSCMARIESKESDVSALGAVMAFLYVTYIVINAILSSQLGRYIDSVSNRNNGDIHPALFNVAGVQFTVLAGIMLLATLIPKGALSLNPALLDNQKLDQDIEEDSISREKGSTSDSDSDRVVEEKKEDNAVETPQQRQEFEAGRLSATA